jgi:hypothetical protein
MGSLLGSSPSGGSPTAAQPGSMIMGARPRGGAARKESPTAAPKVAAKRTMVLGNDSSDDDSW